LHLRAGGSEFETTALAQGYPMMIPFGGVSPTLRPDSFVAHGAVLIGDICAGEGTSFWYNVVVRGDVCPIRIGDRVNVQDLTMIHVSSGRFDTNIGDDVTIGHRAIVHGCTIASGCLIGMGAIISDGATIGAESLIGSGALVPPGATIPPRSLVVGMPGRVVRELRDDEVEGLYTSAHHYVALAKLHASIPKL